MFHTQHHECKDPTLGLTSNPSYAQKELFALTQLLHLINHHNKNQHRLSKWYKSLSTFRRQTVKLVVEVQELDTALAFSVVNKKKDGRAGADKSAKEGKYVRLAREKVEMRVAFWVNQCLERWFIAFSNLTADGQYASLGLTLLGCLAKAQSLIRPFSKIQDITVPDPIALIQKTTIAATNEDDLGEVVSREAVDPAIVDTLEDQHSTASGQDNQFYHVAEKRRKNDQKSVNVSNMQELGPASNPNAKKKSKKKRKRGDEFDDLFSTLL